MVIVIITLCQRDSEPQPDPVASAAQEPALHAAGSAAVRCPPAGVRWIWGAFGVEGLGLRRLLVGFRV